MSTIENQPQAEPAKDAWNLHKRYTIPLALSIGIGVVCELIFREEQLAILAGILVLAVSMINELRDFVASCNVTAQRSANESFERLMSLLKIHNKFFNDKWLYDLLREIVQLSEQTQPPQHGHRLVQSTIETGLSEAKKIASGEKILYSDEQELRRMGRLKDVVDDAHDYIWAVTFDAHGYLNNFWSANFGEYYVEANRQAVARNVTVKRIFVLPESVLSREDHERWKLVQNVINELLEIRSPKMIVMVAKAEVVLNNHAEDTSFLIIDDHVASESYTVVNGRKRDGYICFYNNSVVTQLRERFCDLELLAVPPEKFGFKVVPLVSEGNTKPHATGKTVR